MYVHTALRKHVYIILTSVKPHFYKVKMGFIGVYIIFLIYSQTHRLRVCVRTAVLTSTHNLCFKQTYEENQNILSENFHFLMIKFSVYLNRNIFVMAFITKLFLPRVRCSYLNLKLKGMAILSVETTVCPSPLLTNWSMGANHFLLY